jgi:hypothetical protein
MTKRTQASAGGKMYSFWQIEANWHASIGYRSRNDFDVLVAEEQFSFADGRRRA